MDNLLKNIQNQPNISQSMSRFTRQHILSNNSIKTPRSSIFSFHASKYKYFQIIHMNLYIYSISIKPIPVDAMAIVLFMLDHKLNPNGL